MDGTLPPLTVAARFCLWEMTLTAMDRASDKAPERCYFAGWEHLAEMLGYDGLTPVAKVAVARAVGELTAKGLIKRDHVEGYDRRKAVYRLTW